MIDNQEFLPCPLCQCERVLLESRDRDQWGEIVCQNKECGLRLPISSVTAGTKHWNTRPTPAPVTDKNTCPNAGKTCERDECWLNERCTPPAPVGEDARKALEALKRLHAGAHRIDDPAPFNDYQTALAALSTAVSNGVGVVTVEHLAGDMVNALYDYKIMQGKFGDTAAQIIIRKLASKYVNGLKIIGSGARGEKV